MLATQLMPLMYDILPQRTFLTLKLRSFETQDLFQEFETSCFVAEGHVKNKSLRHENFFLEAVANANEYSIMIQKKTLVNVRHRLKAAL